MVQLQLTPSMIQRQNLTFSHYLLKILINSKVLYKKLCFTIKKPKFLIFIYFLIIFLYFNKL